MPQKYMKNGLKRKILVDVYKFLDKKYPELTILELRKVFSYGYYLHIHKDYSVINAE